MATKGIPIHVEVSAGSGQTNTYTETLKVGAHKLRIRISSDSYDFQSSARIEVWRPADLKWSFIADIHYSRMATRASYVHATPTHFKADRDNLLAQALQILEG